MSIHLFIKFLLNPGYNQTIYMAFIYVFGIWANTSFKF